MDKLEKLLVEIIKNLSKEGRLTDKRIKQLYSMIGTAGGGGPHPFLFLGY